MLQNPSLQGRRAQGTVERVPALLLVGPVTRREARDICLDVPLPTAEILRLTDLGSSPGKGSEALGSYQRVIPVLRIIG